MLVGCHKMKVLQGAGVCVGSASFVSSSLTRGREISERSLVCTTEGKGTASGEEESLRCDGRDRQSPPF